MAHDPSSRPATLLPAAVVFSIFVLAGSASLYNELSDRPEPQRAVPGSPTAAPSGGAPGGEGQVPPGHPSIELPDQVIQLLKNLQANADAAPDDLEAWLRLARGYYRAGILTPSYHKPAMTALDHVLEIDADNLEALRMYGNVAHDARQFDVAEGYFNRYLEINPGDPGVLTDRASTWLFQGRAGEAEQAYRDVIVSNPEFVQAHVNLGIALHARGETEKALENLRHARTIAETEAQQQRIDEIIAAASSTPPPTQRAAASESGGAAAGGGRGLPAAQEVRSNAASPFQFEAGSLLTGYRIVGPRIVEIDWQGDATARVMLRDFPMDQMPPVMRNKFKSGMNEKLAGLAESKNVETDVKIELVDEASGRVMDVLDGKEWVGAFDEQAYE